MNSARSEVATLFVFLAIAFIPAVLGAAFSPDAWYDSLVKPSWNPPSWLFGPVWTVLHALIGYAGYLAWSSSNPNRRYGAFSVYAIQLLLNGLWSPLFFGYHSPGLALVNIVALWVAIGLNIVAFYRIKPASGLLLMSYLVWVSFATVLNASIWALNR
jgi:translocator protein